MAKRSQAKFVVFAKTIKGKVGTNVRNAVILIPEILLSALIILKSIMTTFINTYRKVLEKEPTKTK